MLDSHPFMLSAAQSFVLGCIQGLTEFLPISSSAHLILFPRWMGWPDPGLAFDVALHMGTLAAVLAYFRRDLILLGRSVFLIKDETVASERRLAFQIVLATVPGAVAGLLLEKQVESVFRSPHLIGWTLIVMGTLMGLADRLGSARRDLNDMSYATAFGLGVAQSIALVPGVSRSGITITTALALGFMRPAAARFSFLMSIPITAGAGLLKAGEIWASPDKASQAAGFLGAALAGFLAIWGLLRYVQRYRYTPFVVYRWVLGAFILLNLPKL